MTRNENGYIIMDDFQEINSNTAKKGRKEKVWLEKDGERFLFKTGASFYEIWAELIACELGKQCKLNMAEYDLAIYKNKIGIISRNFLKPGERIYSGEHILAYAERISFDNNEKEHYYNSIESIIQALAITKQFSANDFSVLDDFIKLWAFDGLIMESDRNSTNWAIIQNDNITKLAPIYDCSTMARMNNDVTHLYNNLRNDSDLDAMLNNIKYQMTFTDNDKNDDFLTQFRNFCSQYERLSTQIIDNFSYIDIDKAIKNIENRINKDLVDNEVEIPWQVGAWLEKAINHRLADMINIYNDEKRRKNRL